MSVKKVVLKGKEVEDNAEVLVVPEGADEEMDNEVTNEGVVEPEEPEESLEEDGEASAEPEVIVEKEEPEVVVEPEVVSNSKVAESNVRIRMRTDHNCTIGGEHYYLKESQCYNVPQNVKDILNRAGLLAPL